MTDTYGKSSKSSKLFPGKRSHRSAAWSLRFPWVVFESRGFWFRYPQHNDLGNSTHFFRKKCNFTLFLGNSTPIFEHLLSPHAPQDYALRWDWNTFQRDQPMNMTNVLSNTGTRKARQSRPFQVLDVKHPSVLPVSSRVSL